MRIVPPIQVIEKHATSAAEIQVARLLQRVELHSGATAYWSVRLAEHERKQEAEADFVIVDKDVILVLEVKGGRVSHVDGRWTSVDRYGRQHRIPESPMQQARGAARAIQNRIGAGGRHYVRWDALVITPDISLPPQSLEWKNGRWLVGPDMSRENLHARLSAVISEMEPVPPHRRGNAAKESNLKAHLDAAFDGEASYPGTATILDEQNEATASQAEALARFYTHQLIVTGGAGTGKTLVMAELARREAGANITGVDDPSILVTFRSRGLEPYIGSLLEDVRGVTVKVFEDIGDDELYDVILVDEAQDLMNASDMDVLTQAVRGGLDHGRWRIFLDPNNQAHVDGLFDEETFEVLKSQASALLPLNRNVRNTAPVVTTLKTMLNADLGDPGIVQGRRPFWDLESTGALEDALRHADQLVHDQAHPSDICLIDCSGKTTGESKTPEGYRLTSPAAIKGRESNHVVVFGWPENMDTAGRAAVYVALTRPRVSLSVLLTPEQARSLTKFTGKESARASH